MSEFIDSKVTEVGALLTVEIDDNYEYRFGYVGDEPHLTVDAGDLDHLATLVQSAIYHRDEQPQE